MIIIAISYQYFQGFYYFEISYLPWVKENPTKGRCRPVKALLAVGGIASDNRISASSTSKFEVSVGLDTSGI